MKLDQLSAALREVKEVSLAYLFGSQARGTAGPDSDYDLAVWWDGPVEFSLYANLAQACSSCIPPARLHVVLLNHAPPLLRHRVLSEGRCLWARDESQRVAWEVQALKEYWDTARWRKLDRPGAKREPKIDRQQFLDQVLLIGRMLGPG